MDIKILTLCHAELILSNSKLDSIFLVFLTIEMAQLFEILDRGRQRPIQPITERARVSVAVVFRTMTADSESI